MSARRGPIFNQDDPTIMAAVSGRSPVAAAAVVRKSAVLIRTVPVVYDAADDGELQGATELFDCRGMAAATPNRNFGGTALMPAAFGDSVMAALRQLEVQRPMASAASSGVRPVQSAAPLPVPSPSPSLGLTRFELLFGVSAAVVVGLGAAFLFVYLG